MGDKERFERRVIMMHIIPRNGDYMKYTKKELQHLISSCEGNIKYFKKELNEWRKKRHIYIKKLERIEMKKNKKCKQ